MAIVTATITVDFTANYAGDHRVCFRIQGSGDPYDCSAVVNCVGGGTACQAIINTPVNTTSCDGTITFEGYVQAVCEDILSTNGRLLWTEDFIPTVICQRHELLCARQAIDSVTITTAGQEYLVPDVLTIVRDGADTETLDGDIEITAVGDGVINSLTSLLAGGAGYGVGDTISIVDGTGAAGVITVDAETGGVIDALPGGASISAAGAGYIGPFTFATLTGVGGGADFDIVPVTDYDVFGSILTTNVITAGLYGVIPTVTITTGTGSLAVLDIDLFACPEYLNVGLDCAAVQVDIPALSLEVGTVFGTCIDGGLVGATPTQYDVTQTGCCIPADTDVDVCFDHHIENLSGGPVNVQYTLCDGSDSSVTVQTATSVSVCAIIDGVIDPQVAGVTVIATVLPCT